MTPPRFPLAACALALVGFFQAVVSGASAQDLQVRNYTEYEGLPGSEVRDVRQAPSGEMWFVTRSGVAAYDGTRWSTVRRKDGKALHRAAGVRFDGEGTPWVLTHDGLVFRGDGDGLEFIAREVREQGSLRRLLDIELVERAGETQIFALTDQGWLLRMEEGVWPTLGAAQGLDGHVRVLAVVGEEVFVGTTRGVFRVEGDDLVEALPPDAILPSPEVRGLVFEGASDRLWIQGLDWIATLDLGDPAEVEDRGDSERFRVRATDLPAPILLSIDPIVQEPDGRGGLYFGSPTSLFHLAAGGGEGAPEVRSLGKDNGLLSDGAYAMRRDRESNLWFASHAGVSKVFGFEAETWTARHGLLQSEVSAIELLHDGTVVFGHNLGLTFLEPEGPRTLALSDGTLEPARTRVLDLEVTRDGALWIAASRLGLGRLAGSELTWFELPKSVLEWATAVHEDLAGDLWVGTPRGLLRFDGEGSFELLPHPIKYVRGFAESEDGTLYAASTRGLWVRGAVGWRQVVADEPGASNDLFSVSVAPRGTAPGAGTPGRVLVGAGDGLWQEDRGCLFPSIEPAVGRPVYAVHATADGAWLGTDFGVIRWGEDEWIHYTVADGLAGHETNRAAALVDATGAFWVGTDRGVTVLRDDVERRIPAPLVSITGMSVGANPRSPTAPARLNIGSGDGDLLVRGRALSFVDEERIVFRSRLLGFDPEWRLSGGSTIFEARYSGLPAGSYELELQARGARGPWSDVVTSPEIEVSGPVWRSWWFYGVLLAATALLVFLAQRYVYAQRYARRLESEVRERTRALEQSERELAKAESMRALGVLAGGIAHDFNNALTTVSGHLSMLEGGIRPGSPQAAGLEAANRAVDRAAQLSGQLLTFAKGGDPVRSAVSIEELLRDTASFALSGSGIACDLELADDLLAGDLDSSQTRQALENVLINARQAMAAGGTIRIRAENHTVREPLEVPGARVEAGRYVRVAITDQGPGIRTEDLERIFEPFYSTRSSGHGLGLATAHSVLQRHGGAIVAEAAPGGGTTFTLYLPASEDRPAPARSAATVGAGGPGRVLVVDDEAPIRELLDRLLGNLGYESVSAAEAQGAVNAVVQARENGRPFTHAILDLTIPGDIGGPAMLHLLRSVDPELRFVASSGYSADPVLASPNEYGFESALPKPYRIDQLARVLQGSAPGG